MNILKRCQANWICFVLSDENTLAYKPKTVLQLQVQCLFKIIYLSVAGSGALACILTVTSSASIDAQLLQLVTVLPAHVQSLL